MGSRQRRGKAAMSLTEARQGRGRELEAEARQTKFEARPRRPPEKNPPSPRCIAMLIQFFTLGSPHWTKVEQLELSWWTLRRLLTL